MASDPFVLPTALPTELWDIVWAALPRRAKGALMVALGPARLAHLTHLRHDPSPRDLVEARLESHLRTRPRPRQGEIWAEVILGETTVLKDARGATEEFASRSATGAVWVGPRWSSSFDDERHYDGDDFWVCVGPVGTDIVRRRWWSRGPSSPRNAGL